MSELPSLLKSPIRTMEGLGIGADADFGKVVMAGKLPSRSLSTRTKTFRRLGPAIVASMGKPRPSLKVPPLAMLPAELTGCPTGRNSLVNVPGVGPVAVLNGTSGPWGESLGATSRDCFSTGSNVAERTAMTATITRHCGGAEGKESLACRDRRNMPSPQHQGTARSLRQYIGSHNPETGEYDLTAWMVRCPNADLLLEISQSEG